MEKALSGVRVLDMTHVQAGPSCTQLMAWLGADVIKLEPPTGDITRTQLRDIPGVDSLYFTMLNSNKRSITVNMKNADGKEVFSRLVKSCDVLLENFGPGVLNRLGFPWEKLHELNPRLIYASIKGFGDSGPYANFKAYEVIAQAMGGSMSTTGWWDGPPTVTGSQIGDSGTGVHALAAILAALYQRTHTGKGQYVVAAMQDAILNLCRVKIRDHQRLSHGPLKEYPTETRGLDYVPRSGNATGGGQPGTAIKCKPGGANDYLYVVVQPQVWPELCKLIGREELITDAAFATPEARLTHLQDVWNVLEFYFKDYTKWEMMDKLNGIEVPCGPVLSTKEIVENEHLILKGMIQDIPHPTRGTYKTVGCPLVLSDSPVEIKPSPLLGEHTDEILLELGFSKDEAGKFHENGAV
ncbi:MAG: formyl-CoA transferase [Pseudomonadota bacterium]|nr:formyl-CoA transferase [Pseudomonadota bacterium]